MPKYNNQFVRPHHYDHDIVNEKGSKVGTIRVKPTGVLWKPKSAMKFYAVPLDRFVEWITGDQAKASRTKS